MKDSKRRDLATAFIVALMVHAAMGMVADMVRSRNSRQISAAVNPSGSGIEMEFVIKEKEDPVQEKKKDIEQVFQEVVAPILFTEETVPVPEPDEGRLPDITDFEQFPSSEATENHLVQTSFPTDETNAFEGGHEGIQDDGVMEVSWVGLSEIKPRYPFGSRLRGEEGVVTVRAHVSSSGQAELAEITKSSGFPALDRAALIAVRKARFVAQG